jgi:ferredoxin--NADP+ reductase
MVSKDGNLTLEELRAMGFQAIMVSVGAQGTKWLGLPGEEYKGVYHAKDIVYHYNKLPPFSAHEFAIGKRVAWWGSAMMMDIAHWVIRDLKVDGAIAVARRGPAEVEFTKKEMEGIARNLDLEALTMRSSGCADHDFYRTGTGRSQGIYPLGYGKSR